MNGTGTARLRARLQGFQSKTAVPPCTAPPPTGTRLSAHWTCSITMSLAIAYYVIIKTTLNGQRRKSVVMMHNNTIIIIMKMSLSQRHHS